MLFVSIYLVSKAVSAFIDIREIRGCCLFVLHLLKSFCFLVLLGCSFPGLWFMRIIWRSLVLLLHLYYWKWLYFLYGLRPLVWTAMLYLIKLRHRWLFYEAAFFHTLTKLLIFKEFIKALLIWKGVNLFLGFSSLDDLRLWNLLSIEFIKV